MPTIYILQSIKIDIYAREHVPPHFHAIYAEHEILISIRTLKTYAGKLPSRQYKQVIAWASDPTIKAFLLENFYRLNPKLKK